jgi:ATP-binding cassette subfamily B protein
MKKVSESLTLLLQTFREHKANWQRSFRLIWTASPLHTTAWSVLLIIQGILPGLLVYLTKLVVDSLVVAVNSQGEWEIIRPAVFYIAAIALVMLLTEVFQSLLDMVRTAQADIIQDYIKNLVHDKSAVMDMAHFESHEYHDRLEQATSEGISRPLSLLESIGGLVQNAITLILVAGLLLQYSVWLPLVLLISTLPAFVIVLRYDREYNKWWQGTTGDRRWIQYFDIMLTHPNAVAELRAFNLNPHFQTSYQNLRRRLRNEKLDQMRRLGIAKLLAGVVSLGILGAAVGWMGWRTLYGALTLGDLALFYQAVNRSQGLMRTLLGSLGQIIKNSLFLNVLFEFLDLRSDIIEPDLPTAIPLNLKEGIRLRNVTFRYPGTKRSVFENFSLFIPAGKAVAIVGENGSGKTTLIKLICRFYDPEEGSIEFDGTDIRSFSVKELLRMITITYQKPLNYHATVSESIAMGDLAASASAEEIEKVSRSAGAHDFISRLPDNYNTLLGKVNANGAELSGGEWQRLALARAYFRKAPIVLLDEPTSFMDSWSESDWFHRFRQLIKNRTAVVITHRFTIAMRADIIFVMDKGKVVESGSHSELVKLDGLYAKSWKEQMRAAEIPDEIDKEYEILENNSTPSESLKF